MRGLQRLEVRGQIAEVKPFLFLLRYEALELLPLQSDL